MMICSAPRWLLLLLVLWLTGEACSQNVHNFTTAPGQRLSLLADPNNPTVLSVDVEWDEESVDSVTGLLLSNGSVYSPHTFKQATNSTKGEANFNIDTLTLTEGRHTLELKAAVSASGGSPSVLKIAIFVQDPVNTIQETDFLLSPTSTIIPTPDGVFNPIVSVTNSSSIAAALCYWDFGVVNGKTEEIALNLPDDFPAKGNFVYDMPGSYTAQFHCRNALSSSVVLTSTIQVQGWVMSDFTLSIEKYQIMNGINTTEDFLFNLSVKSIKRPPAGITAHFTYGDGSPEHTFLLTALTLRHRYPRRGLYMGSLRLVHPDKGSTEKDFTARIGAFQLASSALGGLVDEHTFTFTVSVPPSFSGYVNIYVNKGVAQIYPSVPYNGPVSTTNHNANHVFEQVGQYTVSFTGYTPSSSNPHFRETGDFPDLIEVDSPVDSSLVLTMSKENVLTPPGEVTATVLLSRSQHDILFLDCALNFKELQAPGLQNWTGRLKPGQSFNINFQYMSLGLHDIICYCSNSFSNHTITSSVFAFHPCFSPDPIFDRQYRLNNPMVVLNSVDFRLVTRTIIKCPEPSFLWWLEEFTPDRASTREHTDLEQTNTDYIEFGPGTLEPALYKLRLNISFGPDQNNTWLAGATYVRIVRAPLVAEISGGNLRITGDPRALINGYNLSHDPVFGTDNKTGLHFVWECKTFSTENFDDLTALSSQTPPEKLSSDCDDISKEVFPGQRKLQVADDISAVGFLFKMSVRKGNDTSPPAFLFLQYDRRFFHIELRCAINCEKKTAVTSPLAFSVDCHTCTDADMLDASYAWSIALYNNDTGQFDFQPDFLSQFGYENGPTIVITENSLDPCSYYRIMVRVMSTSGKNASAAHKFLTNCPPWGGNCSVYPSQGDVLNERFTLFCVDWQDDGFAEPSNVTGMKRNDSFVDDADDAAAAKESLYYKFMLRKNNVTVPIAEGGESTMPRIELPLITGEGGGDYQLVARIYDVLQDYTEVTSDIYLNASQTDDSLTLSGDTIRYWKSQINYTDRSSTLNKQLRGLSTASVLLDTIPLPEDRSTLEIAAADTNDSRVVNQHWDGLWYDLYHPLPNPDKDQLIQLTETFTNMVHARGNESTRLTGQGISALGEGMSSILANTETTDLETVLTGSDIAEKGSQSLRRLYTKRPFPISARLHESVYSMTGLVDKILLSSLPSYDLSLGTGLHFNSTDVGEDDSRFMVSRLKQVHYVADLKKINTTRTAMPKLTNALNTMQDTLLSSMVLDQPTVEVKRDSIALAVKKTTGKRLNSSSVSAGTVNLQLDTVDENGTESDPDLPVEIRATVFNKNPFAWSRDRSSYEVTSPVVTLNLTDRNGRRTLRKLTLRLKRGETIPVPAPEPYSTEDTRAGPDGWFYHQQSLRDGSSAVVTRFQLPNDLSRVIAYFRTGRSPTSSRYDVRVNGQLVHGRTDRQVHGNGTSETNSGGTFGGLYQFFVPPGSLSPGIIFVGFHLPEMALNATREYGFLSFSDLCRVWDEDTETWDASACTVSKFSTPEETVCICDDPPGMSFASSFFVAPNTIDFSRVFLKFDVTNASVYGSLIGLFCLWILALVWARRKDIRDRQRWLVGYLKDNRSKDRHFYLMTVYTGMRRGSGTRSNVRFVLTGSKGRTRVRQLSDGQRTLSTGSVLTYIVTTSTDLGRLIFLRLWHDDSGEAQEASWYLSKVVLEDLQNGERYNFICERWFARNKQDGLIDRVVAATLKDQVMTFDKRFHEHARVGITDSHLWLSCAMRPDRSSFTRMQRVSCCLLLLLLTMVTSALFYQPEDNETGESTNKLGMEVSIGPLRFSLTTLWTSTVSIVITTIPVFIFVILFRSYRPRPGPRIRVPKTSAQYSSRLVAVFKNLSERNEIESRQEENLHEEEESSMQIDPNEAKVEESIVKMDNCEEEPENKLELEQIGQRSTKHEDKEESVGGTCQRNVDAKDKTKKDRPDQDSTEKDHADHGSDLLDNMLQQNLLPHCCVYLAWILLVVTMAVCAFVLILFSMQWGSTTSEEWLASFFISFLESFFVLEPVKLLILACLLAYCAGNPFSTTQHQYVDIHRVRQEAQVFGTEKIDLKARPPKPVSGRTLKKFRQRRQQEQVAQSVFFELIFYAIFVFCVFTISYNNRDQRTFRTNDHLKNMLYSADGHAPFPFELINSREDVMRYMNETLIPIGFPWTDMVDNDLSWQRRLFTSDFVSFRVGPVRVRQLRMPRLETQQVTQKYPALKSSSDIYSPYDSEGEDTGNYCPGWKPAPCSYEDQSSKLSLTSWSYVGDVLPVSIWGTYAYYSSGGYIADFAVNRDVIAKTIQELDDDNWLDLQTRAVFVELCLYNPNTNLFTFLRMGAEFPELGANNVWRDMKTLRLYPHLGAMGVFVFICQLMTLLFVLFFTVRAILRIKDQKGAYFKDFWQVLDLMTLIMAYVTVAFYINKILSVQKVMASWRQDPKVYVDFFLPVLWDTIYGYLLAGLVFVVSLRLLRVLGYNRRITMLATVLAQSGSELFGFFLVFFIVFSAYASTGHVLFVSTLRQFRSILETYSTLYIVLLGKNRIGHWIGTQPPWAQAYCITFVVLVVFILFCMFQAILCGTTTTVRCQVGAVPAPYGVTNVLARMYRAVFTNWMPTRPLRQNNSVVPLPRELSDSVSCGPQVPPACTELDMGDQASRTKEKGVEEGGEQKPKKPLPTHRPDDVVPTAALFSDSIEVEMAKLKKEMREILKKEKEEKRQRKAERKRKQEEEKKEKEKDGKQ